jgi:hypothetical protein
MDLEKVGHGDLKTVAFRNLKTIDHMDLMIVVICT